MDAAAEIGRNPGSKHQIQPEYGEQADAGRDGRTRLLARPILGRKRGQETIRFPRSTDHEQDWQPYSVDPFLAIRDYHTYILHTYIHTYMTSPRHHHRQPLRRLQSRERSTPRRKTPRRRCRAEEKQVSGLVPRYLLPPSSRYVDMW